MDGFSFEEILSLQRKLEDKYEEDWGKLTPEMGKEKLLYLYGELGEVGDVIKKNGCDKVLAAGPIRDHLLEETADCLMYLADFMLCYHISADELGEAFRKKLEINMNRWK